MENLVVNPFYFNFVGFKSLPSNTTLFFNAGPNLTGSLLSDLCYFTYTYITLRLIFTYSSFIKTNILSLDRNENFEGSKHI